MKSLFIKSSLAVLLFSSVCLAQPKSVHWSALGKYLVDQDGKRTKIEGHPVLVCYQGPKTIKGKFAKEIDGKVYLYVSPKMLIRIDKPVCDLIK